LIHDLNDRGTTIFLTTHYIEEAERLCKRIAFIVSGRIVRIDTTANLMRTTEGRNVVQFTLSKNITDLPAAIEKNFPALKCHTFSGTNIRLESKEEVKIGPLVRFIEDYGAEVSEARKIQMSLEEVFVEITGIEVNAMKSEKEKTGPER